LGNDDHDRPGALAFHALFVARWAYRWAGSDPFLFAGALRREWGHADQDQSLPAGYLSVRRSSQSIPEAGCDVERLASIVTTLSRGQRVIVRSNEPIDLLARAAWNALPSRVRGKRSVATWAFDNANQFDLVALPNQARGTPDAAGLCLTH